MDNHFYFVSYVAVDMSDGEQIFGNSRLYLEHKITDYDIDWVVPKFIDYIKHLVLELDGTELEKVIILGISELPICSGHK